MLTAVIGGTPIILRKLCALFCHGKSSPEKYLLSRNFTHIYHNLFNLTKKRSCTRKRGKSYSGESNEVDAVPRNITTIIVAKNATAPVAKPVNW